jgi:hypothetical protein
MNEALILQRLLNLENETGLVEFISYDVLLDDPGLAFPLAVLVSVDLVMVDPDNQTIALTREGREVAIGLWGVGVDIDEEREKMEEERQNTDFSEVWAEA